MRSPQWFMLLVAMFGILSGCRSSRDWEAFARRHQEQLNQALGLVFKCWPSDATFLTLTRIRTTPDALLRLIRQRWSIENEWHWPRDAQLGEDAHRYANPTGAPVFSFLRTVVMNLLQRCG